MRHWTEAQRRAIELVDRDVCVDAGAGSGKTLVLVNHIMHVLEQRLAKLDEIVAITFTDLAAQEMRARVRKECHARAPRDNPEAMDYWRMMERRTDSARISTIHSFCRGILKENALALGIDPEFRLLDEPESHLLRRKVIRETVHAILESDSEARESARRLGAVHGLKTLLDTLDALLVRRAAMECVKHDEAYKDPETLLDRWQAGVAIGETERLEQLKHDPEFLRAKMLLTAAADCCTKSDDKREQLRVALVEVVEALKRCEKVDEAAAAWSAIAGLNARGGSIKNWSTQSAFVGVKEAFDNLRELRKQYCLERAAPEIERTCARLTCDLTAIYTACATAYESAKDERAARDFDDLILETLRVLRENAEVRRRTADGIKYLLIDEFQDTDERQLEIARLLRQEAGPRRLFIVGDAKQSIYRFRGAQVDVFDRARSESEANVFLDVNFRSVPGVLAFVNDYFRTTNKLKAVEPEYRAMTANRAEVDGCCVEFLITRCEQGTRAHEARAEEAERIADRIVEMCGPGGLTVWDRKTDAMRPACYGDVAILFRAAGDAYLYERALRDRGVPYVMVAGRGFFERQEVRDLRNLIAVTLDPWDGMSLLGFLRGPLVAVSDDALARVCMSGVGLAAAFESGTWSEDGEADAIARARDLVRDLRSHAALPVDGFLRRAFDLTGYEAILLGQHLGRQKCANIRKVADLASSFAQIPGATLAAFLRYLDDVAAESIQEGEAHLAARGAQVATLMTIHKAKGLEFPIVAIADAGRPHRISNQAPFLLDRRYGLSIVTIDNKGEWSGPTVARLQKDLERAQDDAERARILYVALTRACDRIVISGCVVDTEDEPKAQGWLESFDEQYGFASKSDGAECMGDGWRAVVRTEVAKGMRVAITPAAAPLESASQYLAQAAPYIGSARAPSAVSVTAVLDAMFPRTPREGWQGGDITSADRARLRGQCLHRLMEHWDPRADLANLVDRVLRAEWPMWAMDEKERAGFLSTVERFGRSALGKRIAREGLRAREVPFVIELGGAFVHGVIDAVLDDGSLLDYKTGCRHAESHARYEAQLRLYAAACAQIGTTAPPNAYLYYVDCEETDRAVEPVSLERDEVAAIFDRARATVAELCFAGRDA